MRGRRRLDYRSDRPPVLQNITHRAVCTVGGSLHCVGVRCRNDVFLFDDGASWPRQFIDPIQFHDARPLSATTRSGASTLRDSNANVRIGGSGPCANLSRRLVQSPFCQSIGYEKRGEHRDDADESRATRVVDLARVEPAETGCRAQQDDISGQRIMAPVIHEPTPGGLGDDIGRMSSFES